jgi:DNA-directed RNA polymerase specialized sigma24 family protein
VRRRTRSVPRRIDVPDLPVAIARNQLYTYLRRLPKGEHVDFEETSIADLVPSLNSQLDRARDTERLRIALSCLAAEHQLLLELHYCYELDAEALGEVFGATPGAIRVRLLRARKALRERMGQIDVDRVHVMNQDSLIAALSEPEHEEVASRT